MNQVLFCSVAVLSVFRPSEHVNQQVSVCRCHQFLVNSKFCKLISYSLHHTEVNTLWREALVFCPVQYSYLLAKCRFQRTWHVYQGLLETRQNCCRNLPDFKKLFSKSKQWAEVTHLIDLPRAEVKECPLMMLSILSIHPRAKCMKMWHESRNFFMKTDTSVHILGFLWHSWWKLLSRWMWCYIEW